VNPASVPPAYALMYLALPQAFQEKSGPACGTAL